MGVGGGGATSKCTLICVFAKTVNSRCPLIILYFCKTFNLIKISEKRNVRLLEHSAKIYHEIRLFYCPPYHLRKLFTSLLNMVYSYTIRMVYCY